MSNQRMRAHDLFSCQSDFLFQMARNYFWIKFKKAIDGFPVFVQIRFSRGNPVRRVDTPPRLSEHVRPGLISQDSGNLKETT